MSRCRAPKLVRRSGLLAFLCFIAATVTAEDEKRSPVTRPEIPIEAVTPERLTHAYCSACHNFLLVRKQRLNRAMWQWVMDDMVVKFGAGWITPEEQEIIIDYLVQRYGPERNQN